jgi:hypothetical protein
MDFEDGINVAGIALDGKMVWDAAQSLIALVD